MRLCVASKLKPKFCNWWLLLPPLTKKWGFPLLLLLTVTLIFTLTLLLPIRPSLLRRPRTSLIFNNTTLCDATTTPAGHSRGRREIFSSKLSQKSIVIIVPSARKNLPRRNLVRQTWGSIREMNNIKILAVIFFLGHLDDPGDPGNPELQGQLEAERDQFGDLIMGNFVDTYRNLTRKTIMAYEWLTTFCQEAEMVVKTDDDVVVNMYRLTEELNKLTEAEVKSSNFWCAVHWTEEALTNLSVAGPQFYVPPDEFPGGIFPKHCAGVGYFTPMGVIGRILEEIVSSFLTHVCTHEDVFMTGAVPLKINSKILNGPSFSWMSNNFSPANSIKNEPIKHIDRITEWYTYALEDELGDDAQFLVKLVKNPMMMMNETENWEKEFRKKFQTKIFYLINHGPDLQTRFHRLWEIIVKTFA